MALWAVALGAGVLKGSMAGHATGKKIDAQIDHWTKVASAKKTTATAEKNAYNERGIQSETMHSQNLLALTKTTQQKVSVIANKVGGSGAQIGSGSPAHVIKSEQAKGESHIRSYQDKMAYEYDNIIAKGQERYDFNMDLANQAQAKADSLDSNRSSMVQQAQFGGLLGGAAQGAMLGSSLGVPV